MKLTAATTVYLLFLIGNVAVWALVLILAQQGDSVTEGNALASALSATTGSVFTIAVLSAFGFGKRDRGES